MLRSSKKEFQEKKSFWAQRVDGYWSDIGNPTQYVEAIHDIYAGKTNFNLPETPSNFFDNGTIFWPGAKERTQQEGTHIKGNAIVALPVTR